MTDLSGEQRRVALKHVGDPGRHLLTALSELDSPAEFVLFRQIRSAARIPVDRRRSVASELVRKAAADLAARPGKRGPTSRATLYLLMLDLALLYRWGTGKPLTHSTVQKRQYSGHIISPAPTFVWDAVREIDLQLRKSHPELADGFHPIRETQVVSAFRGVIEAVKEVDRRTRARCRETILAPPAA